MFIGAALLGACGSDGGADCTAQQFSNEVNDAIDDVNAAGQVYANDPTTGNCNAFKNAANNYLNVVEDFDGCAGISQAEYNQAVDAARAAVNSIPC